ncbi:hypothetical protein O3P69_001070 [Scylla paramamosain]|uniref:Uncharacterized protein n=1 Tax=Scylla paramamosain TaxID=85552 RepID=A0AAW0UR43_SCYPA
MAPLRDNRWLIDPVAPPDHLVVINTLQQDFDQSYFSVSRIPPNPGPAPPSWCPFTPRPAQCLCRAPAAPGSCRAGHGGPRVVKAPRGRAERGLSRPM